MNERGRRPINAQDSIVGPSARVVVISADRVPQQAFADLADGALLYRLWSRLAFHDIRQRFRRSVLGPFWLTLSMGIMIGAMGFVFSALFHQDVALTLPYIAIGIIFWGLLTGCINDGTAVFISAESFIRNVPMPISVHLYRMLARNVFIWLFNMVIYLGIVAVFRIVPGWGALMFIPGFLLLIANATWMALAAGILSTRYRDIPQVISNIIQVVFYVTPVFWESNSISANMSLLIAANPFYHLIAIVRDPLLGQGVPPSSWVYCIALTLVGFVVTAALYRRTHARIAYWV